MRPGIMSLNEESVNEAASSQIPELRTSETKEKISRKSNNFCANDQKIPIQAQTTTRPNKLEARQNRLKMCQFRMKICQIRFKIC